MTNNSPCFFFVLCLAMVAGVARSEGSNPSSHTAPQTVSMVEQIRYALDPSEILDSRRKQLIRDFIRHLQPGDLSRDELASLNKSLSWKIERDIDQFRILLEHLDDLRQNNYTKTLGQLKNHEMKQLRESYQTLKDEMAKIDAEHSRFPRPLSETNALKTVSALTDLLTGPKPSVDSAWQEIRSLVRNYYSKWNKRMQELAAIERERKREPFGAKVLSYDEVTFMTAFRDAQGALRRISEPGSRDF